MKGLLDNAMQSLQLGIEDYQASDPKRMISAVRNFYAGILLLGKEVLARQAPNADPQELLSMKYQPVPDGNGGMRLVCQGTRTVDFRELGVRLRRFGVPIDKDAFADLERLNKVRNQIEHHSTSASTEAIRNDVAKSFPVVSALFRYGKLDPQKLLGNAWQFLLGIRELYTQELEACRQTFSNVRWMADLLKGAAIRCPYCGDDLVEQTNSENQDQAQMECKCRSCGTAISAKEAVVATLESLYYWDVLDAADAMIYDNAPLQACPECGVEAYLVNEDHPCCAWCGEDLGNCSTCKGPLTPNDVLWALTWGKNQRQCANCGSYAFGNSEME